MQLLAMATTNINRRRIPIKLKDKRRRGQAIHAQAQQGPTKAQTAKRSDQRIEYLYSAILLKESTTLQKKCSRKQEEIHIGIDGSRNTIRYLD